jgi:hypothetical protein
MTRAAPLGSGTRRPVPSAPAEVDQPVQDRSCIVGRFDLEPDGLGKEHKAELEEGAAGLLPSGEIRSAKQGVLAVFEPKASRSLAAGDLNHPMVHEMPPLLDPSAGVVGCKGASNRDADHATRLMATQAGTDEWREPRHRFARGADGFCFCWVLPAGEVADRRPCAHVLWVSAELLEPERPVGALEDVDTAIGFKGLVTGEHQPRFVEARRHG